MQVCKYLKKLVCSFKHNQTLLFGAIHSKNDDYNCNEKINITLINISDNVHNDSNTCNDIIGITFRVIQKARDVRHYFIHVRIDLLDLLLVSGDGNIVTVTVIFIVVIPGLNGPLILSFHVFVNVIWAGSQALTVLY